MNDAVEAIILKQTNYKDNDVIINVISKEYGKLSFVARGVRKINSKNAAACNIYNLSKLEFNYKETATLQSLKTGISIDMFRHIREDLIKQSIASLFVEVVDKIELNIYDDTYDLLYKSLNYLNTTKNPYAILGLFIAKINDLNGINPYVDGCVKCGNSKDLCGISLYDGGFICLNCFDELKHHRYNVEELRLFRLFNKASIDNYDVLEKIECNFEDCKELLDFFLEYSGINLKSYKFLKEISELSK